VGGIDIQIPAAQLDALTISGNSTSYITVDTIAQTTIFNKSTQIADDKKIYFGTNSDAYIEYNEDGDDYLIISGSTNGVAISGSSIAFDGNVKIGSNYHTTTFENQLADGDMGSGEILYYGPSADTTLTKGRLYYLKSDGVWTETNAAAATTATSLIAIALGTSARTHGMLIRGFVKIPSTEVLRLPAAADGLPVYVATTAGHLDFNAPSASSEIVRVVGYCIDDDSSDILLYFKPDNTWVEIA